jgi:N-acetylglucosaminyl-diphospho-decaprenol L-rhamnosyltransferase
MDLSVIIVSFNTRELMARTIEAVVATVRDHSFEVIVVDNASGDGTAAMLRAEFPWVRVIETGANLGFARGVNRGLAVATGRCVLLLNSDTRVLDGALDELVRFLDGHPEAGVAAPHLLNEDLTDQGTARAFPSPVAAFFGRRSLLTRLFPRNRWSRRYLVGRDRVGEAPFRVDWVSGACLMVPGDMVRRVGPLDEHFFMYWEDADWCRRIGAAGYGVYCVPAARVVHYEGKSGRARSPRLVWEFHRSVYWYYVKHHAPQPWSPLRPFAATGLFGRAALLIALDAAARVIGRVAPGPAIASRSSVSRSSLR